MRTTLITLLVVALAGSSWALTGLPEGGTGVNDQVKALLTQVKAGQETIRIDDMVFRVDTLEKAGFVGDPWPGGVVRYHFDDAVSAWRRSQWLTAAAAWSEVANVTFIEGLGDPPFFPHIYVFEDAGNFSEVGYTGVTQEMGIVSWGSVFIIAHEIGHALGFVHEHQRTDRGTFVEIVLDNVEEGKEHNYYMEDTLNLTPYDFDSLMHYRADEFIKDGYVCPPDCCILVLPPNEMWQWEIGQRTHLSELDIMGVGIIYGVSCRGPIYVSYYSPAVLPVNGSAWYPYRSLAAAVAFACPGGEIRLFPGSQPFSPIVIADPVVLKTYVGPTLIE